MTDSVSELRRLASLAGQLADGLTTLANAPQDPQVTIPPATALAKPGVLLNIGGRPGQNHFQLDIGRSGDKSITTKTPGQLATYSEAPYFYTVGREALFGVRVDGPTTPGSKNPRSELRELGPDGAKYAFNPFTGDNYLSARSRPIHLPAVKPSVVFGQLHSDTDDVTELAVQPRADYTSTGKLEVVCRINGTSVGLPKLVADYRIGDELWWMIRVGAAGWQIYLGDMETPVITSAQAGRPKLATAGKVCYFKAGAYLQTNLAIERDATAYGLVGVRDLRHWHTGWPAPAVAA